MSEITDARGDPPAPAPAVAAEVPPRPREAGRLEFDGAADADRDVDDYDPITDLDAEDVRYAPDQAQLLEPLDADERRRFEDYRADLEATGRVRPAEAGTEPYEYQRAHCGPTEYRLSADTDLPRATWADGLNSELGLAQDAKHVGDDSRSWYRPDTLPPAMQRLAEQRLDDKLAKYNEQIADPGNPVRGVEFITNDPLAADYIAGRVEARQVPGIVRIQE